MGNSVALKMRGVVEHVALPWSRGSRSGFAVTPKSVNAGDDAWASFLILIGISALLRCERLCQHLRQHLGHGLVAMEFLDERMRHVGTDGRAVLRGPRSHAPHAIIGALLCRVRLC
jgi:hypothetical protein